MLPNATQSFTLTVNSAPVITSAAAATFAVGSAGSFTVVASGSPAPAFTGDGWVAVGGDVEFDGGVVGYAGGG